MNVKHKNGGFIYKDILDLLKAKGSSHMPISKLKKMQTAINKGENVMDTKNKNDGRILTEDHMPISLSKESETETRKHMPISTPATSTSNNTQKSDTSKSSKK